MGKLTSRMKDVRFRRTEDAILAAFFSNRSVMEVRALTKRAKIARMTFYRHHKNIHQIMPDLEEYVVEIYGTLIRGLMRRQEVELKTLYYQTLIFMIKNQRVFRVIINRGDGRTLEKMIRKMEPKIVRECGLSKNCEFMMKVFEKEIAAILEIWLKNRCKTDEGKVLRYMMYLTITIRGRLMMLEKDQKWED